MNTFLKSDTGKLFIGGCGTQIGLMFGVASLAIILLFCVLCASTNVLTIGLAQEVVASPSGVTSGQSEGQSSAEMDLLLNQIDSIRVGVRALRETVLVTPPPPPPTPVPAPPRPIAIANMGAANLRGGPGLDYNRIGRLPSGQSLVIVGRNNDSTWWLVATPEGLFAWVSDTAVSAFNITDDVPVVAIPALLVQPGDRPLSSLQPSISESGPNVTPAPTTPTPIVPLPAGTPTAVAKASRRFVQDTLGYKQLIRRLLLPTVSESFSPHGDRIAITEKIKLYTIKSDGSSSRDLLEDDDTINLVGNVVWSADGKYLAFVADQLENCGPCRQVGLVRMSDGSISFLDHPPDTGVVSPRWTQDGRLLVTVYWDKPANGTVFVYDTSGRGQVAAGAFLLSSNHRGQKWFPWLPGKIWQSDPSQPIDSYYDE